MRSLNLIDKAFLLKKSSLFSALDLDLLLSIADKMESVHYRPMDLVFQFDQDAYRMYLIISGHVSIFDKNGVQIAELSAGDFFGDEAMFNEKRRTYKASCKTKVELLSLSRSHLLTIIHECPSVALSLLEAYSATLSFRSR
jgi:CRP/FNR family transcriptional regulator, cyclic AMP receptor protein